MKKARALLIIFLVVPLFAQNPVELAKTKIVQQKQAAMVEHAKILLERKEDIEKELVEIDAKLAQLADGKDVKMPSTSGILTGVASGGYLCCSVTFCTNSCDRR